MRIPPSIFKGSPGKFVVWLVIGASLPLWIASRPDCPFHQWTGWYCPACGATRALRHLAAGDWLAAMQCNLLVLASPILLIRVFPCRSGSPPETGPMPSPVRIPVMPMVLGVMLAFGILRNLPFPPCQWLVP